MYSVKNIDGLEMFWYCVIDVTSRLLHEQNRIAYFILLQAYLTCCHYVHVIQTNDFTGMEVRY